MFTNNSTLTLADMLCNDDGGRLDAEAGRTIRYTGGVVFITGAVSSGAGAKVVAGTGLIFKVAAKAAPPSTPARPGERAAAAQRRASSS